jgi:hypothetical protein
MKRHLDCNSGMFEAIRECTDTESRQEMWRRFADSVDLSVVALITYADTDLRAHRLTQMLATVLVDSDAREMVAHLHDMMDLFFDSVEAANVP